MTGDQGLEGLLRLITNAADLDEQIDADTRLISSGLVDSFDLVVLVTTMEERYGVTIPVEDISVDAFDTPRLMLRWIEDR